MEDRVTTDTAVRVTGIDPDGMKVVVLGNSGSGKSTFARILAARCGFPHLDLDTIAWNDSGVREDPRVSFDRLRDFLTDKCGWVVEGSYGFLAEEACRHATHLAFLNPGVETCLANCRERPWESHKYPDKEAQDANLEMLLEWVGNYEIRDDEFSLSAHRRVFDAFQGTKRETTDNHQAHALADEWSAAL